MDDGEGTAAEGAHSRLEAELRRLVQLAAADRAALGPLIELVQPHVVRYCRSRLIGSCGIQTADDVAQDILVAVCDAVARFVPGESAVLAFVFGIARNKIADAFRAAGRDRSTPSDAVPDAVDDEPGPEPAAVTATETDRLRMHLHELPAAHREVIVMRVALGYSAGEVAALLGSTPGAVRVTQHRAMTRLRALMSQPATPEP